MHGGFMEALLINPLSIVANLMIMVAAFWMTADLLCRKETFLPAMKKDWNNTVKIALAALIVVN